MSDLQKRLDATMSALDRMTDQRDQLAAQLRDATAQCGMMAELLREAKESVYFHLESPDSNLNGLEAGKLIELTERIADAMAGKLPEPRITKPARVWGARFVPGVLERTIIEAAYRYAEYEASEEEKQVGKINLDLLMAAVHKTVPEGWQLVPVEPSHDMLHVIIRCGHFDVIQPEMAGKYYRAMLAASPKPEGKS